MTSSEINLPNDVLELAISRSASLEMSLSDYLSRLIVADILRSNADTIHVSESDVSSLMHKLKNAKPISSRIRAVAQNIGRDGF